jgi:GNAT superfamily N-acetyltransferase
MTHVTAKWSTPPEAFITQMIDEGDPLDLADLLADDEMLITAYLGRKAIGVTRLSTPFGPGYGPHLSISDTYILAAYRRRGVADILLREALSGTVTEGTLRAGGVVYTLPIHGEWQIRHLFEHGFRFPTHADYRRWPFLSEVEEGGHPVLIFA